METKTIVIKDPDTIDAMMRTNLIKVYQELRDLVDNYERSINRAETAAYVADDLSNVAFRRLSKRLGAANAALYALGQAAYN